MSIISEEPRYYVIYAMIPTGRQLEAGPYTMQEAILKRGEMSRYDYVMDAYIASENEPRPSDVLK